MSTLIEINVKSLIAKFAGVHNRKKMGNRIEEWFFVQSIYPVGSLATIFELRLLAAVTFDLDVRPKHKTAQRLSS